MTRNRYWHGNSAKTTVLNHVVDMLADGPVSVFDFGCGSGGDWPSVLADHPTLHLRYWDPHGASLDEAKRRLSGAGNAELANSSDQFLVDVVVSFSVFEHVVDRLGYLNTVDRVLRPGGTAFVNYDDGHFRTNIDLHQSPKSWRIALKEEARNRLSPLSRRVVRLHHRFQRRVTDHEMTALLASTNLELVRDFYSNVVAFKGLFKTMPPELQDQFVDFWVDVEQRLNNEFRVADNYMGSRCNLWRMLPARTLVLRKKS